MSASGSRARAAGSPTATGRWWPSPPPPASGPGGRSDCGARSSSSPPVARRSPPRHPHERHRSEHERHRLGGPAGTLRRGSASLSTPWPSCWRSSPGLELHLVGDGPQRTALVRRAERLGLADHVTFHGGPDPEARAELIASAWLSVTASESEGWGPGVIESNAQGVPVLAYRRPGLRDSIRHQDTGWLIEEDEPLSRADGRALRKLADPSYAELIGMRAQRWIARFTWEEMAKQIMDVLRAEEGRLGHLPDDRRTRTDLSTVAVVPFSLLPEGQTLHFRPTDRSLVGPEGLVLLLRGTDTESARTALRRAGLSESAANHPSVRTMVARPRDLVSLDATMDGSSTRRPRPAARRTDADHIRSGEAELMIRRWIIGGLLLLSLGLMALAGTQSGRRSRRTGQGPIELQDRASPIPRHGARSNGSAPGRPARRSPPGDGLGPVGRHRPPARWPTAAGRGNLRACAPTVPPTGPRRPDPAPNLRRPGPLPAPDQPPDRAVQRAEGGDPPRPGGAGPRLGRGAGRHHHRGQRLPDGPLHRLQLPEGAPHQQGAQRSLQGDGGRSRRPDP